MTRSRLIARALAAAGTALSLSACADSTAPVTPQLSPSSAAAVRPSFDISGTSVLVTMVGDTATASFKVKPNVAETFVFGGKHAIKFPTAGICHPTKSSYGATEWDKPCTPADEAVKVSLKAYKNSLGTMTVEFQPALRFNPATTGVFLYLEDGNSTISPWFKEIYFCNDAGVCVDEALTDSSLTTYYNTTTKLHARRVKHFSGYMVGVGNSEEGL